ncbi:MAG: hypothetical protein LBQ88_13505, partial [Treponema sp.]|nr:hypothetical protein [Treponema sp.]
MAAPQRFCVNFNDGWKFFLGDGAFAEAAFDDGIWKPLTLPHDWSVDYPVEEKAPAGGGGGYAVTGIGWYRKRFTVPRDEAGKKHILRFDGIYMDSTVYINGQKAGGRLYGYSSFSVDITAFLVPGENLLSVRVNNSLQPNSRWYTGSGIYRNVWLTAVDEVHIAEDGIFIAVNGLYEGMTKARLQITSQVRNDGNIPADVYICHR